MAKECVGVIGAGQMGNGIAQVFAQKGYSVKMMDIGEAQLERGMKTITKSCDRLIKKERMTEPEKKELLGNIQVTTDLAAFR